MGRPTGDQPQRWDRELARGHRARPARENRNHCGPLSPQPRRRRIQRFQERKAAWPGSLHSWELERICLRRAPDHEGLLPSTKNPVGRKTVMSTGEKNAEAKVEETRIVGDIRK